MNWNNDFTSVSINYGKVMHSVPNDYLSINTLKFYKYDKIIEQLII